MTFTGLELAFMGDCTSPTFHYAHGTVPLGCKIAKEGTSVLAFAAVTIRWPMTDFTWQQKSCRQSCMCKISAGSVELRGNCHPPNDGAATYSLISIYHASLTLLVIALQTDLDAAVQTQTVSASNLMLQVLPQTFMLVYANSFHVHILS